MTSPLFSMRDSISYVTPLSIDECVTRLKRYSYSGAQSLHVDSITPNEYIFQSYGRGSARYPAAKKLEGILKTDSHGGTWVSAWKIGQLRDFLIGIICVPVFLFFIFATYGKINAVGFLFLIVMFFIGCWVLYDSIVNTHANRIMNDIERLLPR